MAEGLGRFGALFDGDMAREARKANKKERRLLERQQKESAGGGSGGGEGEELLEMELAKAHSTAQPERVRKEKKAKRLSRQEIDGMGLRQLKAALKEPAGTPRRRPSSRISQTRPRSYASSPSPRAPSACSRRRSLSGKRTRCSRPPSPKRRACSKG